MCFSDHKTVNLHLNNPSLLLFMSEKRKRYFLDEEEIPRAWYNIQADMPVKPLPPLNPQTREPMKAEDLYPIFARECCDQELNTTDR